MRSRAVGAFFLAGLLGLVRGPGGLPAAAVAAPPEPAAAPTVPGAPEASGADSTRMLGVPAAPDAAVPPAVPAAAPAGAAPTGRPPEPAWRRQKSPRTAMFASWACPGLGQLYNERPFWAAVAAGVEFYFIGSWVEEQRLTNRYRAIYNADPTDGDAQVLFELHRDSRIQAQWLLALTVAISGLQSYVDAALADFDSSPLPLHLAADNGAGRTGLAVQWRF